MQVLSQITELKRQRTLEKQEEAEKEVRRKEKRRKTERSQALSSWKPSQLRECARALGVNQSDEAKALDADNHKQALIELIIAAEASLGLLLPHDRDESFFAAMELLQRLDEAMAAKSIRRIWNLYEEIAYCSNKPQMEYFKEKGLLQKAKDLHAQLGEVELRKEIEMYEETFTKVKNTLHPNTKLVLASSPEVGKPGSPLDGVPVLTIAAWAINAVGGVNIAGDADDKFHKLLMNQEEMEESIMGWRTAWKGKLEGMFSSNRDADIILFSLAGGKETQWEREYLLSNELKAAHGGNIYQVKTYDGLHGFLNALALFGHACPRSGAEC